MATTTTLLQEIAAFNKDLAGKVPATIIDTFVKEQARFEAAGLNSTLLKVGSALPDGELLDAHGKPTTLKATLSGKPAFIVFYRGAWCPYCNLTLRAYEQQVLPTLKGKGISFIALSPQKADKSLTTQETNKLTYPVLSDPANHVATRLGITTAHSDEVIEVANQIGNDIKGHNIDGTSNLPMPTVVGVDAKGIIRFIDVHPNYITRTEPQQIIDAIPSLL